MRGGAHRESALGREREREREKTRARRGKDIDQGRRAEGRPRSARRGEAKCRRPNNGQAASTDLRPRALLSIRVGRLAAALYLYMHARSRAKRQLVSLLSREY